MISWFSLREEHRPIEGHLAPSGLTYFRKHVDLPFFLAWSSASNSDGEMTVIQAAQKIVGVIHPQHSAGIVGRIRFSGRADKDADVVV
jgi:hypothetical protein